MITLYASSAIIGGGLVILSAFFGGDSDADADVDVDADADADGDTDGGLDGGPWIPFLSFKFWTFGACFFGLTGLALAWFTPMAAAAQLLVAAPAGLLSGLGASWTLRQLSRSQISSSMSQREMIGCEAEALFPIAAGAPGKIRFTLHEREFELLAVADPEHPIARGDRVVILEIEEGRARVIPHDRFLPS